MGEIADAALWAEENGIDPCDMSPEDWIEYYEDTQPASPSFIHGEASMFLHYIDENRDDESPPTRSETLLMLFPDLAADRAADLIRGLEALAELDEPAEEEIDI
ncbi:hypothetical protein [Roseibium sp. Sym1]|uniref:hypothetical protein n=1 Tax=Roseibium sp. Sym1 TaxID=3016006 RepID=UPI0022B3B88D|nr:hypothetical protein [Roseibium sp. Sym1]